MTYLLDTNACVDYLRLGTASRIASRLQTMPPRSVGLCSMVIAELEYGARRSADPNRNIAKVHAFCSGFDSLPFDDQAAAAYGLIKADLFARGVPIGPNDLVIAAIALSNGLTLITHNVSEFSRVSGLTIEDWQ